MIDFLNSLKELNKEELEKKLKNLTDEEKEILNNCEKCESVNGHTYSGYNLYFILTLRGPGIYGTFKQWLDKGYSVKKGAKGVPILTPIFSDKEKETIAFFKTTYIFNKDDTDKAN